MHTALKIRTFLLLIAALFTGLALALPQPAQACWISFVQQCTAPDGSTCYIYCSSQDCPGATGCFYTGDEYCCPV
ncbi:MAG TPA: hypothetical protein VHC97_07530 [Thermoanaerobaculia bacterium]|jgi:hypothetical protein|nr:hypothetical protein [Thermoanaerobaculia bacterium]